MSYTKGPWIAASSPSSVVGWPVVRQGVGRSICSVSYLPKEADAEVYAENEANARLIAAAPELLEALLPFLDLEAPAEHLPEPISSDLLTAIDNARTAITKATGADQ